MNPDFPLDNKYQHVKLLGRGGFGEVILAREKFTDQLVAIKKLNDTNRKSQHFILREARAVAGFNLPNVVVYKHHFFHDDHLHMVMEYCEGGDLRKYWKNSKKDLPALLRQIITVANTLHVVHEGGIVHNDIKPDNILVTSRGEVKLSDFGMANSPGGTRAYSPPERIPDGGEPGLDPRKDLYALAVTMLEILTGRNPFHGATAKEFNRIHANRDYGLTDQPAWLIEFLEKALHPIPELRFQTAADFHEALILQTIAVVADKESFRAAAVAEKVNKLIEGRKWSKAKSLLEYSDTHKRQHVQLVKAKAMLALKTGNLEEAMSGYESALRLNPRLDVQKELAWIHLERGAVSKAISLLSDHLHRYPSDKEGFNLLLKCYYKTGRYELATEFAEMLLNSDARNACFLNNYLVCWALTNQGSLDYPKKLRGQSLSWNPFIEYNKSVLEETTPTYSNDRRPSLESKLLFMDYRFIDLKPGNIQVFTGVADCPELQLSRKSIITVGRKGFEVNDVEGSASTSISRRHFVILNFHEDLWLVDLESATGTFVDGQRVENKICLLGKHHVEFGDSSLVVSKQGGILF
jgi:serine/threonine protein kinase